MTIETEDRLADTVPGTAYRLSISHTQIYAEIKAGRLRAVKMGGKTLITRADQQAWLDSLPQLNTAAGT